ncbi:hypothetical protein MHU86_25862 [Fragilaria crotonensis]|nr:hypothetical protein MHU86_25862 [Fragilaria crotonensis]
MMRTRSSDTELPALPPQLCNGDYAVQLPSRTKHHIHPDAIAIDPRHAVHAFDIGSNAVMLNGTFEQRMLPFRNAALEMATFCANSTASLALHNVLHRHSLRKEHIELLANSARRQAHFLNRQLAATTISEEQALAPWEGSSHFHDLFSQEKMNIMSRHRRVTMLENERELVRIKAQQIIRARRSLLHAKGGQLPSAFTWAHPHHGPVRPHDNELPFSSATNQSTTSNCVMGSVATPAESLSAAGSTKSRQAAVGRKWQAQYDTLVHYQARFQGKIPRDVLAGTRLGTWINEQRKQYKSFQKGMDTPLNKARIDLLDQIGFVWNAQEDAWQRNFNELVSIHKQYGTWILPADHPKNRKLGLWVKEQRRHRRLMVQGKPSHMTTARARQLEDAGFCFEPMGDNAYAPVTTTTS